MRPALLRAVPLALALALAVPGASCTDGAGGGGGDGGGPLEPRVHRGGVVSTDTTWPKADWRLQGSLTISGGTLTIEACSIIRMPPEGRIEIRNHGALELVGTADCPITVTSSKATPARGDWDAIAIYGSSNLADDVFDHVVVQYGGGASRGEVWLEDGASLSMSSSTVEKSSDVGLQLSGDSASLRDFTGNTISGNAGYGLEIGPDHVGDLGMGTYGPNDTDAIHVTRGRVTTDQTWGSFGTPYVSDGFDIQTDMGSAHLTLAAGATVEMNDGAAVNVRDHGGLTLDGTADAAVTLTSAGDVPAAGDWNALSFHRTSDPDFDDIHHAVVEDGGGGGTAMIWVEDGASVAIGDTTVRGSSDLGVDVEGEGAVRGFTGNTLMGNALGGIAIGANHVDALGDGIYGPNDVEGVHVRPQALDHDATWADLGTPYVAEGGFEVQAAAGSAVLTLAAGTTLALGAGGSLAVRDGAGLTLDGTSDAHVTVTSAEPMPAAGDWGEIDVFAASAASDDAFHYADITYGGGNGDGEVWLEDGAGVTLDHVTFSDTPCDVFLAGTTSSVDATSTSYDTCM